MEVAATADSQDAEEGREEEFPPAMDAWSVAVPEADQEPPSISTDTNVADQESGGSASATIGMPKPVESWTDELFDDDAVASDQPMQASDADAGDASTDFPEPVPAWSIGGAPTDSESETLKEE